MVAVVSVSWMAVSWMAVSWMAVAVAMRVMRVVVHHGERMAIGTVAGAVRARSRGGLAGSVRRSRSGGGVVVVHGLVGLDWTGLELDWTGTGLDCRRRGIPSLRSRRMYV